MPTDLPVSMHPVVVRCPRCGYDLRGVVGLWTDACPLEGTCSECGLAFDWARVCCPDKFVPTWCVEYGFGLRVWWGTIRRAALPWVFWRRLQLSHPPRLGRLTAHVGVFALLLLLLTYIIVQGSTAVAVYVAAREEVSAYAANFQRAAGIMNQRIAMLDRIKASHDPVEAFQQAFGEFRSASAESIGEIIESERQRMTTMLQQYQAAAAPELEMSLWLALAEGIFTPWRAASNGVMIGPPMGVPYPAPSELHFAVENRSIIDYAAPFSIATVFVFFTALMFPVTMLLLVQTRRRTKLHIRHLARITLYHIAVLGVLLALALMSVHELALWTDRGPMHPETGMVQIFTGAMIVQFIWWLCALWLYARMPHAFFVVLIHLAMAVLLVAAGGYALAQMGAFR